MLKFLSDLAFGPDKPSNFLSVKVIKKSISTVFLVQDQKTNKFYAMKVFSDEYHSYYKNSLVTEPITHKNICSTLDSYPKGNSLFRESSILMEYAPYGDLHPHIGNGVIPSDEKLARTFFHHVVEGIECLHKNGIAHLDLKIDNLVLGDDFNLKLIDFDTCTINHKYSPDFKGTRNYRAPEVLNRKCRDTLAADIYSLGILLFVLKTGSLPYFEDKFVQGSNLFDLLINKNNMFWTVHANIQPKDVEFDDDFKFLFMRMVEKLPEKRITISDIKKSDWYNGPIYTNEEISKKLKL